MLAALVYKIILNSSLFLLPLSVSLPSTMEKRKGPVTEERMLSHPCHFFLILVLGLIFMDPFRLSPLTGRYFRPVKHNIAPYSQVVPQWPRDNQSRLRLGRREFVNEVFGPESIEFDLDGNGPYAGLADGRVVRWMGNGVGWQTFAVSSPNW